MKRTQTGLHIKIKEDEFFFEHKNKRKLTDPNHKKKYKEKFGKTEE